MVNDVFSVLRVDSVAGPGRSWRSLHAGVIRRTAKLHQGEGKGRGYVYPKGIPGPKFFLHCYYPTLLILVVLR